MIVYNLYINRKIKNLNKSLNIMLTKDLASKSTKF